MSITLNLAGIEYQFLYTPSFRTVFVWNDAADDYIPFTKIDLTCGRSLDKDQIVLTIQHKLGLI